jgi:hypothetical protein
LRYALPGHVFACLDGRQVVLLDLRKDRYFSFEAAQARGLESLICGWPVAPAAGAERARSPQESERIALQLLEQGLLTQREEGARTPLRMAIVPASAEVVSDDYETASTRSIRSAVGFVAAMVIATVILRWGSLERAVRRVEERRGRRGHGSAPIDVPRTRVLLAAFANLRPFLFTSKDQCLFESLVLIEFLARYRIYPGWVFGVQSRPFAAHCWVQLGDTVLNDTLEHIVRYTPIMAV